MWGVQGSYRQWRSRNNNFINIDNYAHQRMEVSTKFWNEIKNGSERNCGDSSRSSSELNYSFSSEVPLSNPEKKRSHYIWPASYPYTSFSYKRSPSFNGTETICNFCRQNQDPKEFYTSHQLKDEYGNVVCPVLQKYVCEECGATGTKAHTITYCPVLKKKGKSLKNAVSLKNTLHNSCGRIRK